MHHTFQIHTTGWVDIHTSLIVGRGDPQSTGRIKDLFRNQLKPLARRSPGINRRFPEKLKAPNLPHIVSPQSHNGIHTVQQQMTASHTNTNVPIFPGRGESLANLFKPGLLFRQRSSLRLRNVRIRQKRLILYHQATVHHRFRGRHQFHSAGAHARVVAFQEIDFADIGRFQKIETGFQIDRIDTTFALAIATFQTHPLELEVCRSNRPLPTALLRLIGQLNVPHHLTDRQLEANFLSRHDIRRAGD